MGYDWPIIFVKRTWWPILLWFFSKQSLAGNIQESFKKNAQKLLFLKNHLKWSVILSSPSFPNVLHFNKKGKLNLYLRGDTFFAFSALVRRSFLRGWTRLRFPSPWEDTLLTTLLRYWIKQVFILFGFEVDTVRATYVTPTYFSFLAQVDLYLTA